MEFTVLFTVTWCGHWSWCTLTKQPCEVTEL